MCCHTSPLRFSYPHTVLRSNRRRRHMIRATAAAARLPQSTQGWVPLMQRALDFPIESVTFPSHFYLLTVNKGTVSTVGFSPQKAPVQLTAPRQCAVLVLLSPAATENGFQDMCITLTKRTATMGSHKSEMSFPGGHVDADETLRNAAQRETLEEVGLPPSEYEIIGSLTPITTRALDARVTPFVAVATSPVQPYRASPAEVDSIHYLHMSTLLLRASTGHARVIKYRSFTSDRPCFFPCFFASPAQTVVSSAVCRSPKATGVADDCGFDPMLPEDFPGELVWGLTSFVTCELVARVAKAIMDAPEASSAAAVNALLTPSNVVARDPLADSPQ
ncbi:NUDIX hydrolase protein, conserved [Leishmania donovani]|uniref:Mutt-Nudix-related hydrolase 5, putative n=2 Tax=Leishmania donovani TaxID=5661 RepID=E9BT91_LEIDO|nr:NUDIX hydrolase protein, conserved [Leishmania donovani]AYU83375.1 Mutt-Nudix-related hydrolase 5, putative [Leishmania donovani]CBZ38470.1 NUDIX hydrolase protein, conserved [Leishmania donovani]